MTKEQVLLQGKTELDEAEKNVLAAHKQFKRLDDPRFVEPDKKLQESKKKAAMDRLKVAYKTYRDTYMKVQERYGDRFNFDYDYNEFPDVKALMVP
jgi:PDZ domain-containing secreted protein